MLFKEIAQCAACHRFSGCCGTKQIELGGELILFMRLKTNDLFDVLLGNVVIPVHLCYVNSVCAMVKRSAFEGP